MNHSNNFGRLCLTAVKESLFFLVVSDGLFTDIVYVWKSKILNAGCGLFATRELVAEGFVLRNSE